MGEGGVRVDDFSCFLLFLMLLLLLLLLPLLLVLSFLPPSSSLSCCIPHLFSYVPLTSLPLLLSLLLC